MRTQDPPETADAPLDNAGVDAPSRPGLVERSCELYTSLAYPIRMKLIKLLGSNQGAPLSVTDVARRMGLGQPTATKHLSILHRAGWLRREVAGSRVHYSINLETAEEFRLIVDLSFAHALTPCVNHFDCDTCPHKTTCV